MNENIKYYLVTDHHDADGEPSTIGPIDESKIESVKEYLSAYARYKVFCNYFNVAIQSTKHKSLTILFDYERNLIEQATEAVKFQSKWDYRTNWKLEKREVVFE